MYNSLLLLRSYMVLPDILCLYKCFFCIAHNSLGHFGTNKSYSTLHSSFYWINMCYNTEMAL
ncbi:hypothetical protein HETIRDRAFT_305385 [Heterobasidion irregulare TC 32-1]|uniref:Integrase zinc-binding domain-containing protein n=1 Tax=Heterobasidion irregulare (strain TC 32-1) TaxID=747525 RepID=W4KPN7_HETIT|nr:uncharacterized protein HETIRDRAFT_305385 [Heterobasidion irregulare TC 32-1]ETW87783.1 hypothetical protein HETIRDRAFT_305385 [Heterobasidion irregulare TC 32-1]